MTNISFELFVYTTIYYGQTVFPDSPISIYFDLLFLTKYKLYQQELFVRQ